MKMAVSPRRRHERVEEDPLDRQFEQGRQAIGQRQGRVVLVGLDRVDRLAGGVHPLGQFALAQAQRQADFAQPVLHEALGRRIAHQASQQTP
jgi:hypothetical protein